MSTGLAMENVAEYSTMPRALRGASRRSVMMALSGSFGSSSPYAWPVSFSYGPAFLKDCPLYAGASRCSITMRVIRACAGADRRMIPERMAGRSCPRFLRIIASSGSSLYAFDRRRADETETVCPTSLTVQGFVKLGGGGAGGFACRAISHTRGRRAGESFPSLTLGAIPLLERSTRRRVISPRTMLLYFSGSSIRLVHSRTATRFCSSISVG